MTRSLSISPNFLTPLQEGMLFHTLAHPASGVDIEQILITDTAQFEHNLWSSAWQTIINRHAILRTAFNWQDGTQITASISDEVALPLHVIEQPIVDVESLLASDRKIDFDMAVAPLMRLTMFESDAGHHCLWSFHHTLLDGRSFPIVLEEVFSTYDGLLTGVSAELPPRRPFSDYTAWYAQQDFSPGESFWREHLADVEPQALNFATGGEAGDNYAQTLILPNQQLVSLETFAANQQVTVNTLVQAAWGLLLMHYSAETSTTFGNTRACRHNSLDGVKEMVGLLINTVPVTVSVSAETTLTTYLQSLRQQHIDLRQYEHTPLPQIQKWADTENGAPLFNTLLVFENYLLNTRMRSLDAAYTERQFDYYGKTNFPLTLVCYADDGLHLRLEYDNAQFNTADATRILGHLNQLLNNFPTAANTPALAIPYITTAERNQLLQGFNSSLSPDTCNLTPLHVQFEHQVAQNPDAIAVSFEKQSLTYAELNGRANQLAHHLINLGVKPNTLVGLTVERSLDIPVGILGILKAGGAYVPIDPASPADRQKFIAEDANLNLIIGRGDTNTVDLNRLPNTDLPNTNPETTATVDNLAYVIYTSGSTGKPKGALVTHANVSRLFSATDHWFNFNSSDTWTLFHSFAFDFSVWEIWGALLYGGRLAIVPYWVSRDPAAFHQMLTDEAVTVLNQTPTAFRQLSLIDQAVGDSPLPLGGAGGGLSLRYIIFGGEALELPSLRPWVNKHGDNQPQLINMYGITETTVHVTYRRIRESDIAANHGSIIGVPIPDLKTYILDERMQPVPIGVPGEIYVGGAGVTNGYLNRPELTSQRFLKNPFAKEPPPNLPREGRDQIPLPPGGARGGHSSFFPPLPRERTEVRGSSDLIPLPLGEARRGLLYKTGDIARYLPNGDIEYIGRADQQVKIRGFRIELGEIEAVLTQHPAIDDAVVIADTLENGSKQLVAYVIVDAAYVITTGDINSEDIRSQANRQLPDYMLPAFIIPLDTFPLTNNGKLNRRALPKPEQKIEQQTEIVSPRNPLEQQLVTIWQNVLGINAVSIHDNFFALGGDSILSIQIIARLRQAGWQITPRQIFQQRTIAELSGVATPILNVPDSAEIQPTTAPLTPIQHWFTDLDIPNRNHWNQAYLFNVQQPIAESDLRVALNKLVTHHCALNSRFNLAADAMEQHLASSSELPQKALQRHDLRGHADWQSQRNTITATVQSGLSLDDGLNLRAAYIQTDNGDQLFIAIHHLVIDGVSWRILLDDLARLLNGQSLPASSTSYQKWATRLEAYANSAEINSTLPYWQKTTAENSPSSLRALSDLRGQNSESSVRTTTRQLTTTKTTALLKEAPAAYNTQINDILLTALADALTTWTNQPHIQIELEGHGREQIDNTTDLSRTVGWFTTIFPIWLEAKKGNISDHLIATKENLNAIPQRGLSFGLLKYLAGHYELNASAEIVFNYLGQFDQSESDWLSFSDGQIPPSHDPDAQRPHALEIIAKIHGGQLSIDWNYSNNLHDAATIDELADQFNTSLIALIDHCVAQTNTRNTPSDFPLATITQPALDALQKTYPSVEDIYPLSPIQQLFYSVDRALPELGFEQWHFELNGDLDTAAYREAWQTVIDRTPILRTIFISDKDDNTQQIVLKTPSPNPSQREGNLAPPPLGEAGRGLFAWTETDLRDLTPTDQQTKLATALTCDKATPFDLTRLPLMRLSLLRVADNRYHLIWSTHHLQIDGWSWSIIFNAVAAAYQKQALPPAVPYSNYIRQIQADNGENGVAFWQQHLSNLTKPTPLAGLGSYAADPAFIEVDAVVSAEITHALNTLAQTYAVTPSTLIQAAWGYLLSNSSGQNDVLWGATVSGRSAELPNVEHIAGPFVNNLPLRMTVDPSQTISDWLQTLQIQQLDLSQHQHTPLTRIQASSSIPMRHRLFESLVVYQNYVGMTATSAYTLRPIATPQATNYPLALIVTPGDELALKLIYRPTQFSAETITAIRNDLLTVLAAIPSANTVVDLQKQTYTWRETALPAPSPQPLAPTNGVGPTSTLERQILTVWKTAFANDSVGLHDSFFEIGGHSIMLVAIHAELETILSRQFPVTTLFQHPTISELATHLSGNAAANGGSISATKTRADRIRERRSKRRTRG